MAVIETTRSTIGATGLFGRIGVLTAQAFASVAGWNESRQARKALSALTDRELADIGLNRGEIDTITN